MEILRGCLGGGIVRLWDNVDYEETKKCELRFHF